MYSVTKLELTDIIHPDGTIEAYHPNATPTPHHSGWVILKNDKMYRNDNNLFEIYTLKEVAEQIAAALNQKELGVFW